LLRSIIILQHTNLRKMKKKRRENLVDFSKIMIRSKQLIIRNNDINKFLFDPEV